MPKSSDPEFQYFPSPSWLKDLSWFAPLKKYGCTGLLRQVPKERVIPIMELDYTQLEERFMAIAVNEITVGVLRRLKMLLPTVITDTAATRRVEALLDAEITKLPLDANGHWVTESFKKAIEVLHMGVYDGAHHKDWCIQQALKYLGGLNDEELTEMLAELSWEPGIPP